MVKPKKGIGVIKHLNEFHHGSYDGSYQDTKHYFSIHRFSHLLNKGASSHDHGFSWELEKNVKKIK